MKTCRKCGREKPGRKCNPCRPSRAQGKKKFGKTAEQKRKEVTDGYRLRKLGCTPEMYQAMFLQQNGNCAICGTNQSQLKRELALDHDHATGKLRGLLCDRCNVGLGMFQDNKERLLQAIQYL